MHRTLFAKLLLICALLFAQAGSMAHGISHILDGKSQRSKQSLPHDKYCDQCAAYAQIGGVVGSSALHFTGSEKFKALHFNCSSHFISTTFVAFAARAPPHSV